MALGVNRLLVGLLAGAVLVSLTACEGVLGVGRSDDGAAERRRADAEDGADGPPATDPGRVTIHRLNNTEYNNTIRDLLGVTTRPADDFPLDGSGAGFDNIAQVLTLSEPHLVAYSDATEKLVAQVLGEANLRQNLVFCDVAAEGAACIQQVLREFTPRAFRRPVLDEDLAPLFAAADEALAAGDTPEQALTIVLEAVLLSPHFLFRVELDASPQSLEPHALTDYELASRLSYFLWSSMPDETLFDAAKAGSLGDAEVLSTEVERMLLDEKAGALVENFAGQWLYLRKVDEVAPDASTFPNFDPDLRAAMKRETELLFEQVLFGGSPVDQLLTADFTFVNDRLAQHYGLAAVGSEQMVQVDLSGSTQRPGGLLGQASVLTVTSHASTTSPVLRGKWVLGQLLCAEIPPPPPDVNINLNDEEITGVTVREKLEQHRSDPTCNACHQVMDPIGLGLEHYDAIGAYRETDAGSPIDASGELPGERSFEGPDDLRRLIAEDEAFTECLIKNLYTYALGRVPEKAASHMDRSTLEALGERLSETMDFADLIHAIAESPTFRNRRGDPQEAP